MQDIDPVAVALETTGLTLAGACGPGGGPMSTMKGREELSRVIYEVARIFDEETRAKPAGSPGPPDDAGPS